MGIFTFIKDAGEALAGAIGIGDANAQEAIAQKITQHDLGIEGLSATVAGDVVTLSGTTASAEMAEKAILVAGNIPGVASVDSQITVTAPAAPEPQFYTVKSGDTLSKIAKEFYGNANRYPEIFEANKPMLGHPDKIYPGQNLRIPAQKSATAAA